MQHYAIVHRRNNNVQCNVCSKSFRNNINLNNHNRKVHNQQRNDYKCDECDRKYKSSDALLNHINTQHRFEYSIAINVADHFRHREISTHTFHQIRINVNVSIVENITNRLRIWDIIDEKFMQSIDIAMINAISNWNIITALFDIFDYINYIDWLQTIQNDYKKCDHLDQALFRCRLYTCQSKQYGSILMEQNLCSIYKSTNATEFDNKSAEHKAKSI